MFNQIIFSGNDFDESMESSSVFLKKNVLPTYWKLLKLCRSKDHKVRLKAVDSLSKLTSLESMYTLFTYFVYTFIYCCDMQDFQNKRFEYEALQI